MPSSRAAWRGVVRAAPEHELLLAELGERLRLVLALEGAVVALVQPPGAVDRDPVAVRGLQRELGGADGALLEGGVQDIGEQTGVLEQLTAADCLLLALLGEVDVHPTGEQVLRVPFALAVAEEDQLVRCVGHEPERNRSLRALAPPVTGRTAQGGGRGRLTARVNRVAVRNPCFVMFGLQSGHLPAASVPYVPGEPVCLSPVSDGPHTRPSPVSPESSGGCGPAPWSTGSGRSSPRSWRST